MPIVAGTTAGTSRPLCTHVIGKDEEKDVSVNLATTQDWIDGDTVQAMNVDWSYTPADGSLTIDTDTVTGGGDVIAVWVRNPAAGKTYRLKAHVTSDLGRVFDVVILIAGVSK